MDREVKYYVLNDKAYLTCKEPELRSYDPDKNIYTRTEQHEYSAPFPTDLLRFIYLEEAPVEKLVIHADKVLRTLMQTNDLACYGTVQSDLKRLRELHPYFRIVELEWQDILDEVKAGDMHDLVDAYTKKRISHIAANMDHEQRIMKDILYRVLDTDLSKKTTQERMKDYVEYCNSRYEYLIEFKELATQFEQTPHGFAVVLHPKTVFDVVDFALRLCIQRGERMRVCKNCGRYFAIEKSLKAEYCAIFPDEKGRSCRDTGAITAWTKKRENDDVYKNFRREYKKRFARIKAKTLLPDEFYRWSEQARQKKEQCDDGTITPEEFAAWLAKS